MQACLNIFNSYNYYCVCASGNYPTSPIDFLGRGWSILSNCALPRVHSFDNFTGVMGLSLAATAIATAIMPHCLKRMYPETRKDHYILAVCIGAVGTVFLVQFGMAVQGTVDICCDEQYYEHFRLLKHFNRL